MALSGSDFGHSPLRTLSFTTSQCCNEAKWIFMKMLQISILSSNELTWQKQFVQFKKLHLQLLNRLTTDTQWPQTTSVKIEPLSKVEYKRQK